MIQLLALSGRLGSRNLWLILAGLQACTSVWQVQISQDWPASTLLACLVWSGALICLEDQLADLEIRPSRAGAALGGLLLLFSLWRTRVILHLDTAVYALPLLQGLGLALLCAPPRQLGRFRDSLLVLALFPLQLVLMRALPEQLISALTARIAQLLLLLFGWDVAVQGREIAVGVARLQVVGACNGIDLIAQITAIAVIFVLAFPLRSRRQRLVFVALAPALGLLTNAARIALLAAVISGSGSAGTPLFVFFHDQWGALVFAGLAATLLGWIYYRVLDRELRRHESHG